MQNDLYDNSIITKILLSQKKFKKYLEDIIELNDDISYMPLIKLKELDVNIDILLDNLILAKKHSEKRLEQKADKEFLDGLMKYLSPILDD